MQCPKCSYEGTMAEFGDDRKCPECGAYYDKVIQHVQREIERPAPPKVEPEGPTLRERADAAMLAVNEGRKRRKASEALDASRRGQPEYVRLTGVDIPFLSLVWLMTKLILASIPATALAIIIVTGIYSFVSGMAGGYRSAVQSVTQSAALDASDSTGAVSEKVLEACKSIETFAETVMESRQGGMAMSSAMNITDNPLLASIVVEAYERPRFNSEDIQRKTIEEFKNKHYLACIKASR